MTYLRQLVRRFGLWLAAIATPAVTQRIPPYVPLSPEHAEALQSLFTRPDHDALVLDAVKVAHVECGLSAEAFGPDFDLSRTGKLYEVLHHASIRLGIDHSLRTVGDLVHFLESKS